MYIPFPLPAQVGERNIEVTGTSEIEVVPDRIHYVIEIREYFEEEFDGVSKPEEYRTKVPLTRIEEELKQVLKIVGVPREAIRTKDVVDNWRKPGQDFLVSKSFDVTLRDFTLIDEILKRVDTKGIHTMYIDKLEHRDILSYHRKGKIEALKAAREKAVYLLEAIGKRPGEIIRIVELGRAARNGANRKNRQPLAEMYVKADKDLDGFYMDIIREELNIKEVIFTKEVEGFVSYNFKPQLKTVGPKYGKQLGKIREALANLDGRAAKAILDSEGKLSFDFGEGPVELTADDLLIETTQREGFYTVSDRDITVAIDTVLTPALIEEGFMREIISKVQTMRKEAGFEVTDHIRITMEGSEKVTAVAEARKAEITGATLAESLTVGTPVGYTKEWDLNGEKATLGVEKI